MNTSVFRRFAPSLVFLAAAALGSLHAAESAAAPTPRALRPGTQIVDVDFPGGTLAQFVAKLKGADGSGFDLLADTSLSETPVPTTKLVNIELMSLTSALNTLLRAHNLMIVPTAGNLLVATRNPVYTTFPGTTFQAFQLAPYLATLAIDDITDAIATAWAADPKRDPKAVTFKFHPATKVLFVNGPAEAITMASQIIPQLSPTATPNFARDSLASRLMGSVVPPPDTAAEKARLEAVAAEVHRRRAIREATAGEAKEPEKK